MADSTAPRFLLLQIRNPDDPMRGHEVECFATALHCSARDIDVIDLITQPPAHEQVDRYDAVLIGGSGDYSVAEGGVWLPGALETFRYLHDSSMPTFASCWGFQAFARALGGIVVTDLQRAEVGTIEMRLTEAGKQDPVFGGLGMTFYGQLGHQDIVDQLPDGAVLLASSDRVTNEAFTFPNKPIYATQFHPELTKADLIKRLVAYPEYVERITGLTVDQFQSQCRETPGTSQLLSRFRAVCIDN